MNRSAAALVKAAEARLMEPVVIEPVTITRVTRVKVSPDEMLPSDEMEPFDPDERDPARWVERRTPMEALAVQGRRDDWETLEHGSAIAFTALWVADESPVLWVRRRGGSLALIGYRDLVTELKTGVRKTAPAVEVLGAIPLWVEKV